MPAAPLPSNEDQRLATLVSCGVLDTPQEGDFDDLAKLAARLCDAPIALVSLLDASRQWFKSHIGLPMRQTPRDMAFCGYVVHSAQPLVINDATLDARTSDNPLVTGEPHFRFYAGVPLVMDDRTCAGTLCVIDTRARALSDAQLLDLRALARQVTVQLLLRRQAHQLRELTARQESLSLAMEYSPDPTVIVDEQGLVRFANSAAHRLDADFGHVPSPGEPSLLLRPLRSADGALDRLQARLREGRAFNGRVLLTDGCGHERWLDVRTGALRSGCTVIIKRDVTGAVHTEHNLREAMARADSANRAKSVFLANTSHELRTPLTAMVGYLDLIEEATLSHALPEPVLDHLRTVQVSSRRLQQLISDLLDVSRIEAGLIGTTPVPLDLRALLGELERELRPGAIAKGLQLDMTLHESLPRGVLCDPDRLRQVLTNLLGNALKFTETGAVKLHARALRSSLQIDVIDSGPGLSAQQLTSIFEPFVQADDTSTRRHGGAGLGLCIARGVARAMGGDITVASAPGRGSTFTLSLPLRACAKPAPAPAPITSGNPHLQLDGLHVLLAEDGTDNRRLLSLQLSRAGAQVHAFNDGQCLLDALDADAHLLGPATIVLTDVQMPRIDGCELVARLRARGFTGGAVALTASAHSQDEQRCRQAGCDEYASKPIGAAQLAGVCARAHAAGKARAGAGASAM
jgi:signal transduction histidine kinase